MVQLEATQVYASEFSQRPTLQGSSTRGTLSGHAETMQAGSVTASEYQVLGTKDAGAHETWFVTRAMALASGRQLCFEAM